MVLFFGIFVVFFFSFFFRCLSPPLEKILPTPLAKSADYNVAEI